MLPVIFLAPHSEAAVIQSRVFVLPLEESKDENEGGTQGSVGNNNDGIPNTEDNDSVFDKRDRDSSAASDKHDTDDDNDSVPDRQRIIL